MKQSKYLSICFNRSTEKKLGSLLNAFNINKKLKYVETILEAPDKSTEIHYNRADE